MTDKQIIINYKNLCENYSKEVGCYVTFDGSCIKEKCFTYKLLYQLQAKEQECEELKKENYELTEEVSIDRALFAEIDQLKAENEKLKKEVVNLKLNLKKVINLSQKKNRQCYQFLADIKQLKRQHQGDKGLITTTEKMNYQLIQEYDKLKTVLTEIKEIAEANKKYIYVLPSYSVAGDSLEFSFDFIKNILQKISECEAEQ